MSIFRGWQKVSYIDYPARIATLLFVGGCNFRCPYCQNPELVREWQGLPLIEESAVREFLLNRKTFIDAVCISGGEPLLHFEELLPFLRWVKKEGFLVKVDTNGSFPARVEDLEKEGLVDYWAIDFKLLPENYSLVAPPDLKKKVLETLEMALNFPLHKVEFRTTIYPPFHNSKILEEMAQYLREAPLWYWQNFQNQKTLSPEAQKVIPYPIETLKAWAKEINSKLGRELAFVRE